MQVPVRIESAKIKQQKKTLPTQNRTKKQQEHQRQNRKSVIKLEFALH